MNILKKMYDDYYDNHDVSRLEKHKDLIASSVRGYLEKKSIVQEDLDQIELLLHMCADYYTYNTEGDGSLISDVEYDKLNALFNHLSEKPNKFYTNFTPSSWPIVQNEDSYLVGSLDKTYDHDELIDWLKDRKLVSNFKYIALLPKFDGISCAIRMNVKTGFVEKAITRGNVIEGQLITDLINRAQIYPSEADRKHVFRVLKYTTQIWYAKCEILMTTLQFNELNEERVLRGVKPYANRRSAVSGIVNSPKNIEYGKYLTLMPLYWINDMQSICQCYIDAAVILLDYFHPKKVCKMVDNLSAAIRKPEFPFRVDGVVLWPFEEMGNEYLCNTRDTINFNDLMADSIAFKINTNKNYSKVLNIYPSVGKTGKVTPVAEVEPVEVNETFISNVNLSSYNKYRNLALRKGEVVCVYSAGDSIPMLRKLEPGDEYDMYHEECGDVIEMSRTCPYCGNHLEGFGMDIYCVNDECPRIVTGKIINFLEKMGIQNVKDQTISILYGLGFVRSIVDIFKLVSPTDKYEIREKLQVVEGFGVQKVQNIYDSIMSVFNKPIPLSRMLASLGIKDASTKTFKKLLIGLDHPEDLVRGNVTIDEIEDIKGFSTATAKNIYYGIRDNLDLIQFLLENLNIIYDYEMSKGRIVFTGFRNKSLEEKLEAGGFEVSETLTKDTYALIVPVEGYSSSKVDKAEKYGVTILSVNQLLNGDIVK